MEKKKKIIIIGSVIAIMLVTLITVLILNRQEKNENISKEETTVLDISQVFEIDDIEKSKYEIEKVKDIQISSKYIVGSKTYKLNANVEFMEDTGKMLYIRASYNKLNIYQEEQKIDEYDNVNSQLEGIIENFESKCKSYDLDGKTYEINFYKKDAGIVCELVYEIK